MLPLFLIRIIALVGLDPEFVRILSEEDYNDFEVIEQRVTFLTSEYDDLRVMHNLFVDARSSVFSAADVAAVSDRADSFLAGSVILLMNTRALVAKYA